MRSSSLQPQELKTFLLEKAEQYAVHSFIADDPIQIPHLFQTSKDIEISGLLAATLSWGSRTTIIAKCHDLMARMDHSPGDFVTGATPSDLASFDHFVHRTFQADDIKGLVIGLQHLYQNFSSIGDFIRDHLPPHSSNLAPAFTAFKSYLLKHGLPDRASKHFGDPSKGSAAKRMVMYSRWMTRTNKEGLDFGLWNISPALLSLPLDVHSGRTARTLGLLSCKQNNWKAVEELDQNVRKILPEDPAKLDYALFGLGVYEGWK